ncbi:MAG: hypothetical protein V7L29_08875 [Nostoc sp.]
MVFFSPAFESSLINLLLDLPNRTRDFQVEEIRNGYCLDVSTGVAALT